MAQKRKRRTEKDILERHRVALDNVQNQPEIATEMAEYGYDASKITEGKTIFTEARTAYDNNQTENDETRDSHDAWESGVADLNKFYLRHRKKAQVVFIEEPETEKKLAITGSVPDAYINWLEDVKKFYYTADADTTIVNKLSRLKVTADDITEGKTKITNVENLRSEYLRERGEDQNATKVKDAALAKIDKWMREFKAVARIALEDKPQLLETLGIFVRS